MDITEKINKSNQLELKKHVGAIHSAGSLSLLQRKIANTLLYNAYDDLMIKDEFSISIKHLCSLIGYDSNDYKTVKTALIKLLSTVIEWNLIDKTPDNKGEIWNASSIIADARIKDSICTYSYSKRMRELLHMPEMYGRINMAIQAQFQSNYGLALYENCIRYKNLNYTPWIEFALFRKLMGVSENKYLIFRDFKRRVLDKAVEEVNCLTELNLSLEVTKTQGKIAAIRFKLAKQEKLSTPTVSFDPHKGLIEVLVAEFSLTTNKAAEIIQHYGEETVKVKIDYIREIINSKKENIKNKSGYLLDALKYNFVIPEKKESFPVKTKKGITVDEVLAKFKNLGCPIQKGEIIKNFAELITNVKQRNYFIKHGICNSILAEEFRHFILNNYADILA